MKLMGVLGAQVVYNIILIFSRYNIILPSPATFSFVLQKNFVENFSPIHVVEVTTSSIQI